MGHSTDIPDQSAFSRQSVNPLVARAMQLSAADIESLEAIPRTPEHLDEKGALKELAQIISLMDPGSTYRMKLIEILDRHSK